MVLRKMLQRLNRRLAGRRAAGGRLPLRLEALEARVALSPNLVSNGGFEAPILEGTDGFFSALPVDSQSGKTAWSLASGPAIEVQRGAAGTPAEGHQLVELDSSLPSAISQDIA